MWVERTTFTNAFLSISCCFWKDLSGVLVRGAGGPCDCAQGGEGESAEGTGKEGAHHVEPGVCSARGLALGSGIGFVRALLWPYGEQPQAKRKPEPGSMKMRPVRFACMCLELVCVPDTLWMSHQQRLPAHRLVSSRTTGPLPNNTEAQGNRLLICRVYTSDAADA